MRATIFPSSRRPSAPFLWRTTTSAFAGICALQGCFAQLAIVREADGWAAAMTSRKDGQAASEKARVSLDGPTARLRAEFDFNLDAVRFLLLRDGVWQPVGRAHPLKYRLDHFMGCRVGLFAYATEQPSGAAVFADFSYEVMN